MELGSLKTSMFHWAGWVGVTVGLFALAIVNISILSGYDTPFSDRLSLFIFLALLFGALACIRKSSRILGIWSILLALFLIIFMGIIFFLGWVIVPFP